MPFHVKLEGALGYPDDAAARAAHEAMMAGREGNPVLEEGCRVEGKRLVFSFDGEVSFANASARIDAVDFAIETALETANTGAITVEREGGYRVVRRALGREFWNKRWQDDRIAFHEGAANEMLVRHVARLPASGRETEPGSRPLRVLVPLAGKAFDMRWLAAHGYEVVGVESSWTAVRAFFDEQEADPPVLEVGRARSMQHGGVTLVCGDFFDASPADLGRFDVVYDRAALVALEPSTRTRYVETCRSLLAERGVTFLVTFTYDAALAEGPPWSIDDAEVRALYAPARVERLETRAVSVTERLAAAGVTTLEESAYLVG